MPKKGSVGVQWYATDRDILAVAELFEVNIVTINYQGEPAQPHSNLGYRYNVKQSSLFVEFIRMEKSGHYNAVYNYK